MKKIFMLVLIFGLVFGCATAKESIKDKDFTKWTDQELMDRYSQLDPSSQLALGVLYAASSKVLAKEEREAIRKELEARGFEYHPEKKQAAFSSDHPEWVKK